MRLEYDGTANAIYISLTEKRQWAKTRVDDFGLILHFDASDILIGIEVLLARQKLPGELLDELGLKRGRPTSGEP